MRCIQENHRLRVRSFLICAVVLSRWYRFVLEFLLEYEYSFQYNA